MLDGFVVPHAHFRVFQSDRAAARRRSDLAHALSPLPGGGTGHESPAAAPTPTDLHLREFAQLEAQVKAATQQQQSSSATALGVSAHALADAAAGSLVECFTFYTRLMTAESFTWPDFLATVFTKLAEHFVNRTNEAVRSSIVAVFQRSAAHVAQVNDASKLIAHLMTVLTTAPTARARALTLHILETMPTLIQSDAAVHAELVARLGAADANERAAAIAATRALLHLAPSALQDAVMKLVLESTDATTTALLVLLECAVRSRRDAEAGWNHCGVLYHDLADDRAAIECLRAMTALAVLHPEPLLVNHIELLEHAIRHDPRKVVQTHALLSARELFAASASPTPSAFAPLVRCVTDLVCSECASLRTRHSALLALERWCRVHALSEHERARVLTQATALYRSQPERLGAASSTLLATIVHQALDEHALEVATTTLARTEYLRTAVESLLALLHPSVFVRSASAWTSTLACVQRLCLAFPDALAEQVVGCLVELLGLASAQDTRALKPHIFRVLSCIAASSVDVVAQHTAALQRELESLSGSDSSARAALTVALLRTLAPSDAAAASLERTLASVPYTSQADRYELAKLAMTHGHFQLALTLTASVAGVTDSESFGSWLHALRAVSDAEASMLLDTRVGLDSVYQLSRAATYLHAASSAHFSFAFQLHVVELRGAWMQLVLQTQQFAGEAAYSNTRGATREGAARDGFARLAARYRLLRSALLGASDSALYALEGLAQLSTLLALAIDAFLLLHVSLSSSSSLVSARLDGVCAPAASALWHTCKAIEDEIHAKAALLQRIDASRRTALGGRVMQQLLRSVCALPLALPPQFFRLSMRAPQRIASNVQFLTYAESSAFTSKPRPRSQLGVALGTDFNSLLKGVLEVASCAEAFWRDMVDTLEIDVRVQLVDKSAASASTSSSTLAAPSDADSAVHGRIRERIALDWSKARKRTDQSTDDDDTSLFLAFETPIHVATANLRVKGSFQLLASVTAVDVHGGKWLLAPTGCSRGFIVY